MQTLKFVVEQHEDCFVAYPLGLRGVVLCQGDTGAKALADAQSAANFHIETFGKQAFDDAGDIQSAYIAEAEIT